MSLDSSVITAPAPRESRNSNRPLLPFVDDPDAVARFRRRSPRVPSTPLTPTSLSPPPPPLPPSPPALLDSSFSSSSSSTDSDMSSSYTNVDIFLGDHKNPPYTMLRRITVDQFLTLSTAVESFANTKDMMDVTKRRTLMMNVFRSQYSMTFFASRRYPLLLLSNQAFRHAVVSHVVQDRWEDETLRLIDSLKLEDVDNKAFDALEERVTELNDLLVDTAHHLSDEAVKSRLHSAMSTDFRDYVRDNDVLISLPFVDWILKIRTLDTKYRSRDRQRARDFEIMRKTQERLEKELASVKRGVSANQSGQYSNDHSRKQPRTSLSGPGSSHSSSSGPSKTGPSNTRYDVPGVDGTYPCPGYNDLCSKEPKMVDFFRELEMCRRCRTAFAGHISYNCPNTEGPKLKVPHRPLTAALVAFAKSVHDKLKRPITYNAILTASPPPVHPAKSNPVAALSPMDDLSAYSHTSLDNIAALFSPFPVAHIASGSHVFTGDASGRSSSFFSNPGNTRPVAAVIESTSDDSSGDWSGFLGEDRSWNASFAAPVSNAAPAPTKITDFFTKAKSKR